MSCLVFSGSAPSAKTALLKLWKASWTPGASSLRRWACSGVVGWYMALGYVRDGDRDELLGLLGQRAVGEDGLAEALESVMDAGRQLLATLGPASMTLS